MQHSSHDCSKLSLACLLRLYGWFGVGAVSLHAFFRWWRGFTYIDMGHYWPLSIFLPRLPEWQVLPGVLGILGLFWVFLYQYRRNASVGVLMILAMGLVVGTNTLYGVREGLTAVVSERGDSYWDDAQAMSSVSELLEHYVALQPTLHLHSRVHPPGPMVLLYGVQLLTDTGWIAGLLMASVGLVGGLVVYQLLVDEEVSPGYARMGGVLLVLLPASQIYYWASIDAVISTLMILAYWLWRRALRRGGNWWLGLMVVMSAVASMTFGVVFLGPLLVIDAWREGRWRELGKFVLAMVVVMWGIGWMTGYSYIDSFLVAASYEGPPGWYLPADPASYVATRLENYFELVVFGTPVLTYLVWEYLKQLLKTWRTTNVLRVGGSALVSITIFFLMDGYYTGETARAAQYVYPFFVASIAWYVSKQKLSMELQIRLLMIVFGQSLLMQLFGWYAW